VALELSGVNGIYMGESLALVWQDDSATFLHGWLVIPHSSVSQVTLETTVIFLSLYNKNVVTLSEIMEIRQNIRCSPSKMVATRLPYSDAGPAS
jgi:hypothetical protein